MNRPWRTPTNLTVAFTIPDGLWMSGNRDYGHGGWKKSMVDQLQEIAGWSAVAQKLDHFPDPCDVLWLIAYPKGTGRTADPDNAFPTCKPLLDGLVKLGYLVDDNPTHVGRRSYERDMNLPEQHVHRITLTATPVEEA